MTELTFQEKTSAFQTIIARLEKMGQFSAKFLMYASALGMITILGGANMPPELTFLLEGIGINIISSLIERIARGEQISDEALKKQISAGINIDKFESLLTTNDFFRAIAKLKRGQDVTLFKLHTVEFNIVEKLDEVLVFLRENRYLSEKKEYPFPPYIAHPYTLSEYHGFFGRQSELMRLNKWVNSNLQPPILLIIGLGGTGKSALAWNWFNSHIQNATNWDGMFWWSFYKTDTNFGDFIVHSLAYVSGHSLNEIRNIPRASQEQQLMSYLNENRFLFVIDGLERLTLSYAKSIIPKEQIHAHRKHLAQMIDERDGRFLLFLTKIKQSRILITSRVYPFDLCDPLTLRKIPGSSFSPGKMKNSDALALWKSMGIIGKEARALRLFRALHNHPLLIKVLAASIAKFRSAPGDLKQWSLKNRHFNPYQYTSLRKTIVHVFQNTIGGISNQQARILEIVSALRTPIRYDLLSDLVVGKKTSPYLEFRVFENEEVFENALVDLEERGLLAWDAVNNVYDIHPLIKDFVWFSLSRDAQERITSILAYSYSLMQMLDSFDLSIEGHNLSTAIELFYLLIRLDEYTQAWILFQNYYFLILQIHGIHQLKNMLNILAVIALKQKEPFNTLVNFGQLLGFFTSMHLWKGDISSAKRVAKSQLAIFLQEEHLDGIVRSQVQLSILLSFSGNLQQAEELASNALKTSQLHSNRVLEGWSEMALGLIKLWMGDEKSSIDLITSGTQWIVMKSLSSVEREAALLMQSLILAKDIPDLPTEYNQKGKLYSLLLSMVHSEFEIDNNQFDDAQFILSDAFTTATKMGLTLYESVILSMQAELALKQGNIKLSRSLITKALSYPNLSEFKLMHVNLLSTLAEIERREDDSNAINTAKKVYEIAYYEREHPLFMSQLEKALSIIREYGGVTPELPVKRLVPEEISIDPELRSLLKII